LELDSKELILNSQYEKAAINGDPDCLHFKAV
jgi:hypothetical protein